MTDSGWNTLRDIPLARGLDEDALGVLESNTLPLELVHGQTLIDERDTSGDVFVLMAGELSVLQGERLVTVLAAPRFVGLTAALDGRERTGRLEALGQASVLRIRSSAIKELRGRSAAFADNVAVYLAGEMRRLQDNEATMLDRCDDFFEAPNARLVPGPYVAERVDMWMFFMEADPHVLRALLPPGLKPLPGMESRWILTFDVYEGVHSKAPAAAGKTFRYRETCPFLPVLAPDLRPSLFIPEAYPDNLLAIALGREAYGFPKRFGKTELADNSIGLTMGGRLTLRARWKKLERAKAHDFMVHGAKLLAGDNAMVWTAAQAMGRVLGLGGNRAVRRLIPSVPVFVHKQVAAESLAHKREWQVDSLVEIPFNMTAMSDYSVLRDPAVTIFDPHWCLRGTCLGAMRVNVSMGFGEGRTWIDYLVQDPGDNPLVTAMAQRVRGFGKKNDSED